MVTSMQRKFSWVCFCQCGVWIYFCNLSDHRSPVFWFCFPRSKKDRTVANFPCVPLWPSTEFLNSICTSPCVLDATEMNIAGKWGPSVPLNHSCQPQHPKADNSSTLFFGGIVGPTSRLAKPKPLKRMKKLDKSRIYFFQDLFEPVNLCPGRQWNKCV